MAYYQLPFEDWAGRLRCWLPRGISAILLALIGLVIWNAAADLRATKTVLVAPIAAPVTTSTAGKSDTVDRLVASHLFGTAAIHAASSGAPSLQDWKVVGIAVTADAKTSIADLNINGNEHLWHVGDRLPDGSTIVVIASNSVTLNRNGAVLLLPFELRPAAMDGAYPTIAMTKTMGVNATRNIAAPQASLTTVRPAMKSLVTLRAAALRVWAARSRHPPTH